MQSPTHTQCGGEGERSTHMRADTCPQTSRQTLGARTALFPKVGPVSGAGPDSSLPRESPCVGSGAGRLSAPGWSPCRERGGTVSLAQVGPCWEWGRTALSPWVAPVAGAVPDNSPPQGGPCVGSGSGQFSPPGGPLCREFGRTVLTPGEVPGPDSSHPRAGRLSPPGRTVVTPGPDSPLPLWGPQVGSKT
jgi:hypothetical protein